MPSKELRPYNEISKDLSVDDTSAMLNMTCTILKNLNGRPCHYPNTDDGLNNFIENSQGYFDYLEKANSCLEEKQQIIPDIEGYCLWLGIQRTTLGRYHKRSKEWEETIDLFKNAIASNKKQLMLKGRIPSVMGVFDLCNNHGYHNTSEFKITDSNENIREEDEARTIEDRIKAEGLVWDSVREEWTYAE